MTGSVPIKIAAQVMGKSQNYVRHAIEDKRTDIGFCVGSGKRKTYYISPKKFYELTGYEWKGNGNEEESI